jgi:hypothetical protein
MTEWRFLMTLFYVKNESYCRAMVCENINVEKQEFHEN